jgi:putative transposase
MQKHLQSPRSGRQSRYIQRQKEHHTKISFRDEFIQFLKTNGIEYDERYV